MDISQCQIIFLIAQLLLKGRRIFQKDTSECVISDTNQFRFCEKEEKSPLVTDSLGKKLVEVKKKPR